MTEGEWYHTHTWLAPGCVSEPFGLNEVNYCFDQRRIVIAGDISVQGLFWSIVIAIDGSQKRQGPVETDLMYNNSKLDLQYLYDPTLESPRLLTELETYRNGKSESPSLVVIGTGRWHAENGTVQEFKGAIDRVAGIGHSPNTRRNIGQKFLTGKEGPGDLLLFAPVQGPYSEHPESDPELVDYQSMNEHLQELSDEGAIDVLWTFQQMTEGRRDKLINGSPAVIDEVSRQQAAVILGLRCNARLAARGKFPNTRTCCATWRTPNWVQLSFLILALGVLPTVILFDVIRPFIPEDARPAARAFSVFAAMMALQYASDRTHLFEQVERLDLVDHNLYAMLAFIVFIGVITIRRSKPLKKAGVGEKPTSQPFLSRDQTNEWKGWMQALIITYHYNKAWTALWFWEIIRLAVSSYLFLTGFGHTLYFLQKEDYSFRRVANVMIRTNLLPVTLAYVMRTRWLLYYYMPLSTFWFLVVYATLAIAPGLNKNKFALICKIVASAVLVRAFISTKDLPNTFVRLLTLTFRMSFDATAFFDYRVKIDEYIVYVGMLSAILCLWLKDVLYSIKRYGKLTDSFRRAFPIFKVVTVAASAVTSVYFWYWVHHNIKSDHDWTKWQPVIGPIPILAFIVLRNAHPVLRNFYSGAFAWLGKYSGEMYTMQNHIWLAGDQEAVLRTGFFNGDGTLRNDRWRDLVVITPLYLIACWIIGDATGVIANWFLKEDDGADGGRLPKQRHAHAGSSAAVEMGLLAGENVTSDEDESEKYDTSDCPVLWRRVKGIWPSTVWGRAVLTLASLWFMNVVSLPTLLKSRRHLLMPNRCIHNQYQAQPTKCCTNLSLPGRVLCFLAILHCVPRNGMASNNSSPQP
jgi:hypothetical protein